MTTEIIRAIFNNEIIRVYQAYRPEIAKIAIAEGRFLPPFSLTRMTWIKPSFNWMMYRSGFASKQGQEIILGIDITRDGFEWALANASLSNFMPSVHDSHDTWKAEIASKQVRVQWDPERDWKLNKICGVRTIQIGLAGDAIEKYNREWIVKIEDVTPVAKIAAEATDSNSLPCSLEREYPLTNTLRSVLRKLKLHSGV